MTETSTGELCRLVVIGPTSRVDLSVPVHVPVADLLPALLQGLGTDLADRGLEHSGWVLQRLGDPPLDEELSLDELDLVDGESLHLRPRSEQIPPLDFDDLIDGIATGMGSRSGLWRPAWTRAAALTVSAVGLAAAVATVYRIAAHGRLALACLTGILAAAALLAGAWIAAAKGRDRVVAGLLAGAALAFAGLIGLLAGTGLAAARAAGPDPAWRQGIALTCAAIGVSVVGLIAVRLVRPRRQGPWAVALLVSAVISALAGLLRADADLSVLQVSAVILVVVAALRPSIPLLAFRLSGLRLPPLPVTPEDLQTDIEPESGTRVLNGAETADEQMTALHVGLAVPSVPALIMLAGHPNWECQLTVLAGAGAALLSLRALTSAWQRLALGLPAVAGLVAVILTIATASALWVGPLLALALVSGAGTIAAAAHTLPQRRTTPIWGRIGDLLHMLCLITLVPTAFGVLGGYGLVRGMVG